MCCTRSNKVFECESIYLQYLWDSATAQEWHEMCLQDKRRTHSTMKAYTNGSTLRLIGKGLSLITDTLCPHACVCVCTCAPWVPCVGARLFTPHTVVSLAIALLVDAAVTVDCPPRSLDIQCKSNPVELWKKLIICYCSLGPPAASPSEHHCHLTHGLWCDNGQ